MKFNVVDIKSPDNGAYTPEYTTQRRKSESLFNDNESNILKVDIINLSDKYKIKKIKYKESNLGGAERKYILLNKNDEIIYEWKCYDSNCDFQKLIEHSNGSEYLVFRADLYGYSVLDLKTLQTFQYFPQCVLDGYEYFIWTNIEYNPLTNLLAVEGCIWACPWSICVVDFSSPMSEPTFQIDLFDFIEDEEIGYGDPTFLVWDNDNLVCELNLRKSKLKKQIAFNPRQYIKLSI